MGYQLHSQSAPVFRFEFTGRLSAEEADRYFADAQSLLTSGKPHAAIMDTRAMLAPEVEFARRQALWIRNNQDELRRLDRGIAMVIPSALIRGLLRAVVHFQEIPAPYALFDELEEATAWANGQISR